MGTEEMLLPELAGNPTRLTQALTQYIPMSSSEHHERRQE